MGVVNPDHRSPNSLYDLPEGWLIDDGFLVLQLPAVYPTREHLREARCTAYPHALWLYRMSARAGMLAGGGTSMERHRMNADKIGLYLYHFMKKYVPGFLEVQRYSNKPVRLVFEGQSEIIFYGFTNRSTDKYGATLIVLDPHGNRSVLLCRSSVVENAICYPEHRDQEYPTSEIPSKETAERIVSVYACVAAIPRDPEEQAARERAISTERASVHFF